MRLMYAELLKLSRSAWPWVTVTLCVLCDLLLFALYASPQSSVFEPDLLRRGRLGSLFLATFIAILNVIPAVLIGSYVGARDYGNRMAGSVVHWSGRYGPVVGKVLATVVTLGALVVATGVFGLLLGLASETDSTRLDALRLVEQVAIAAVATSLMGLLALTVATLVRSLAVATLTTAVALFAQMVVPPDASRVARFLNPLTFLGGVAEPAFSDLAGLRNFSVAFGSDLDSWTSIFGLAAYLACCLGTLALVARFREYR